MPSSLKRKRPLLSERTISSSSGSVMRGLPASLIFWISSVTDTQPWVNFVEGENEMLQNGEDHDAIHVKMSVVQTSSFHYDEELGLYERWSRGEQLFDYKDGEPTLVKNVFALSVRMGFYSDSYHIDLQLKEGGSGYYASEGKIIPILWTVDENEMFVFTDLDGNPLTVNVGNSYICLHDKIYETTWE